MALDTAGNMGTLCRLARVKGFCRRNEDTSCLAHGPGVIGRWDRLLRDQKNTQGQWETSGLLQKR